MIPDPRPARAQRCIAGLLAATLLAGCAGPRWYAQAVSGHLELMRGREAVSEILSDTATDPALAKRLEAAARIRDFALAELGLPADGSYAEFVRTGREAASWNVVAAPEFSLQPRRWCFLFAGCVPYRGWFDRGDAERFASGLAGRGMDVAVAPAVAYSTLGWFDDPLLDTMLRYGDEQLAAFLFHELAHRQLWVPEDADFSESYASFVEEVGVEHWLRASGQAARLQDWRRRRAEADAFDRLLDETRDALAEIYAGSEPSAEKRRRKQAAFEDLEQRYRKNAGLAGTGRALFDAWFREPPNNARLALRGSYRSGRCAFDALYREAGRDLGRLGDLARERAALDDPDRRAWLQQPCQVIAPRNDL